MRGEVDGVHRHAVVLKGWISVEREVSLRSGEELLSLHADVVFLALHGKFGKDGTVPGLLEVMRLPYTHSGVPVPKGPMIAMELISTIFACARSDARAGQPIKRRSR